MSIIRYQVFVSSTYQDLIDMRRNVIEALMNINAIPAGMEWFPSADEDAWTHIKQVIDLSDYYIVIIGGKYGTINPTTGLSYTEMEYDYAAERKIPIIAFIHDDIGELKARNVEMDSVVREKLETFKTKARSRLCKFWKNEGDLIQHVLASYAQMTSRNPGIGWIRGDEAKTIEDVEQISKLERRVRELEDELSSCRVANEEFITIHNELGKEMAFTIFNFGAGNDIDISLTVLSIFRCLGHALLKESSLVMTEITSIIGDLVRETYYCSPDDSIKDGSVNCTECHVQEIISFLFLRGLLKNTCKPVKIKMDSFYANEENTAWALSEKGREFLLYVYRKSLSKSPDTFPWI